MIPQTRQRVRSLAHLIAIQSFLLRNLQFSIIEKKREKERKKIKHLQSYISYISYRQVSYLRFTFNKPYVFAKETSSRLFPITMSKK